MARSAEQKIRLLVLYDILLKESDDDCPLSTNELIAKLQVVQKQMMKGLLKF